MAGANELGPATRVRHGTNKISCDTPQHLVSGHWNPTTTRFSSTSRTRTTIGSCQRTRGSGATTRFAGPQFTGFVSSCPRNSTVGRRMKTRTTLGPQRLQKRPKHDLVDLPCSPWNSLTSHRSCYPARPKPKKIDRPTQGPGRVTVVPGASGRHYRPGVFRRHV